MLLLPETQENVASTENLHVTALWALDLNSGIIDRAVKQAVVAFTTATIFARAAILD